MINPSARARWAQRMCDLLARPHGRLICHEWPTGTLLESGGPPYFAPSWCYQLHLTYPGNEKVIDYNKKAIDTSPETTSLGDLGLAMLGRCEMQAPDSKGKVLNGSDWVSIWGPSVGSMKRKKSPPHGQDVEQDTCRRKRIKLRNNKPKKTPADHSIENPTVDDAKDEKVVERSFSPRTWLLKRKVPDTKYVWENIYSADA